MTVIDSTDTYTLDDLRDAVQLMTRILDRVHPRERDEDSSSDALPSGDPPSSKKDVRKKDVRKKDVRTKEQREQVIALFSQKLSEGSTRETYIQNALSEYGWFIPDGLTGKPPSGMTAVTCVKAF